MKALALKIPPVVQFLVVAAGMWLLAKYMPALSFDIPARRLLVVLFFCLGGIVAAYTRAVRQSGVLRLVAPRESVREMLVTTKLDTLIPVYDTMEEAAAWLPTSTD